MTTILGSALHFIIGALSVGVPIFFEVTATELYLLCIFGAINLIGSTLIGNAWPPGIDE